MVVKSNSKPIRLSQISILSIKRLKPNANFYSLLKFIKVLVLLLEFFHAAGPASLTNLVTKQKITNTKSNNFLHFGLHGPLEPPNIKLSLLHKASLSLFSFYHRLPQEARNNPHWAQLFALISNHYLPILVNIIFTFSSNYRTKCLWAFLVASKISAMLILVSTIT